MILEGEKVGAALCGRRGYIRARAKPPRLSGTPLSEFFQNGNYGMESPAVSHGLAEEVVPSPRAPSHHIARYAGGVKDAEGTGTPKARSK